MSELVADFWSAFFLGVVAAFFLWFGFRKGFFEHAQRVSWKPPIALRHICIAFGLYFAVVLLIAPLFAIVLKHSSLSAIGYASWINFLVSGLIFLVLFAFWKTLPRPLRASLWKDPAATQDYTKDLRFAVYTWCISFPTAFAVSQFLDLLVIYLFRIKELPDQLAVYFVKMAFSDPLYFLLAGISVLFLAPVIEEFLFRGLLQSYIRKHLGPFQAIFLTSLCFSFFHYSAQQGLANIPIIGSLFTFALFLGFLYEKQGSLFASMALHSLFNAISVVNLYFFKDFPHGAL